MNASSPQNRAGHPPEQGVFPQPLRARRLLPALLALALALVMIFFTAHTYHFLYRLSRVFPADYLAASMQFVSSFTIFALLCVIWVLDRSRRATLVVLLAALLLSGAANGAIKLLVGRARPQYSLRLKENEANRQWLLKFEQEHPGLPIRTDGRDSWILFSPQRPLFKNADPFNSFPSGHSCTAFALAAFLIALYPRGRWLWLLIAAGCAVARVAQRRHFPEDILFGGALGWLMAQWVFSWAWPAVLGRRLLGAGNAE